MIAEDMASEEEDESGHIPRSLICDVWAKWVVVQSSVELYYPYKVVTSHGINYFNDNAMAHLWNILKFKHKEITFK